jgi:hypothetical protein
MRRFSAWRPKGHLAGTLGPTPKTYIKGQRVREYVDEVFIQARVSADVVADLRQRIAEAETAVKLAKRAKLAEQMTINRVAGRRFEQNEFHALRTESGELAPQITVRTRNGDRARLDFMSRNGDTVQCIDCKSSETAPHTSNQKKVYPEIARSGATIVGRGKPGFPGGMVIPPTRVRIIGPEGSSQ